MSSADVQVTTSLTRHLETLAAVALVLVRVVLPLSSVWLLTYLLFCTKYPVIAVLYLTFCLRDRHIAEHGGRELHWVRQWSWFKYARNYFAVTLVKTAELDSKKNYLICAFPHGVIPFGIVTCFGSEGNKVKEIFSGIRMAVCTLASKFYFPVLRELLLSLGFCSVSQRSLNFLLSKPQGGNAAVIAIGGAAESQRSRPNTHEVVLKNRKGFVRIAMQNGASLVPVYTFGETDLYDQWPNPQGSWMRWFQDVYKKWFRIVPIVPLGTGFLGVVPKRLPIFTVVGRPMDVEKVLEPTDEQINELHKKFVASLNALFEAEKHKYLQHPDEACLIIS